MLLRLEDTDRARSEERYAQDIIEALSWLGLGWDGEVIRQSERTDLYLEHLERLERSGMAYRCYCPPEQLEKAREMAWAVGRHWRYPRTCRECVAPPHPNASYVLRLKVPDAEAPPVRDRIVGRIPVGGPDLDDFVLARSDGSPLYNLCCAVDDALLGVTHVIRGADHVDNTRRQALILDALGYPRPQYAHLPLVAGLSKRQGSDAVLSYQERGYLPEAVLNYVARLGWSHGDQEIFTTDELIRFFRLEHVGHSTARVNEDKLRWLNVQHIHRATGERLARLIRPWLPPFPEANEARLAPACELYRTRTHTLIELAGAVTPLVAPDREVELDRDAATSLLEPRIRHILLELAQIAARLDHFDRYQLKQAMWDTLKAEGLGFHQVAPACRLALIGEPDGPRILDLITVLGPESVAARFRRAAEIDAGNR